MNNLFSKIIVIVAILATLFFQFFMKNFEYATYSLAWAILLQTKINYSVVKSKSE